MKKKRKVLLPVLAAVFIALPACEEVLTNEDRAKKASEEFCECMKKNSLSKCEDELNSKYSSYIDDEFINKFNKVNECDIEISKKK